MARGHKGPPQESIDSILLAISRRDDIDADTLAHYFDRLDEEWTVGARGKVLHLFHSNDASAHAAAVMVLSELATDFDIEEIEDVVADPTVSDLAKLSLAPVLKELGSEMADDGIMEYLNDPLAAMQQMQLRLLEMIGQSETGIESILEEVTTMPIERRLGFIAWLGDSHDSRAANLLVPMLDNQPAKIALSVVDALEQLGSVAFQQTIPALNYSISTTSNRELKQHARAALGRLTMLSVPGAADAAMIEARLQQLPLYQARASFIDGSGAQLLMLSWVRPDGLLKGVNLLYHDQLGIKDCYGIDELDKERWNLLISDLDEQGFQSLQIPFELVRTIVAEARAMNKRTRHKIPIAYSVWRPLIEGDEYKKKHTSTFETASYAAALNEETLTLARQSEQLYQLPQFASWMYEPLIRLDSYINRYWTPLGSEIFGTGKRSGRRSKAKMKEQRMLLEQLITEAIDELIDERWRLLYETRLNRQAQLFQLADDEQNAAVCRAVAAVLHPGSPVPLQEQAFPRMFMGLSIEQGPLRMMAESLSEGKLDPLPFNLFESKE